MKDRKALIICSIILLWIVVFGLFLMILTKNQFDGQASDKKHLIGASYMTMNNQFYEIMSEEISNRIEAEGDTLILRDPALSVERQILQIQEMLDMGIDVLVLTPVDWDSLTDILTKAKEKGIYIVVVDSNVKDENLVDCTITSDNYSAGKIVGEYFVSQQQKAKVVLFEHANAKSGQDRIQGFLDAVQGYDGIEIVDRIDCEGQLEIAMPKMKDLIESGKEFDQVFCLNDLSSVGVVAALDEKGLLGQVGVYGVDASPDSKALIKEGMMKATAAQFPSKIGKAAAENIYMLLDGQTVKDYTYIPVELVTRRNVEIYGVERWQ